MERNSIQHYIEINGSYELIGEGFEELTQNNSPIEKTKRYIHHSAPRTRVSGYETEYSLNGEFIKGDKVCEFIQRVGYEKIVNEDISTNLVHVFLEADGKVASKYVAIKEPITILVENGGSGSADELGISAKLKSNGAIVKGKFDTNTKQFTND